MSSQILKTPLPYIALILAHLIWGANFVVAKVTLQEFPTASLGFLRFALATIFLIPFFIAETKKIHIKKEDLPKLVSIGILMITLNITFFFEGIKRTTAINGSVLTLVIPIISVLLGWIVLKEKIFIINLAGILLGLVGALIIVGFPQILTGSILPDQILGNVLIIMASIVWVLGAIISRQMLIKYPSLIVTGIAFIVGSITMAFPAAQEYLQDSSWPYRVTILGFLGLTYMTILSSISSYFLFEWGLAKVGVIKADLLQYIEPFVASFLAITILGEKITTSFLVGLIAIIGGVYLGTLAKEYHHRSQKVHRT